MRAGREYALSTMGFRAAGQAPRREARFRTRDRVIRRGVESSGKERPQIIQSRRGVPARGARRFAQRGEGDVLQGRERLIRMQVQHLGVIGNGRRGRRRHGGREEAGYLADVGAFQAQAIMGEIHAFQIGVRDGGAVRQSHAEESRGAGCGVIAKCGPEAQIVEAPLGPLRQSRYLHARTADEYVVRSLRIGDRVEGRAKLGRGQTGHEVDRRDVAQDMGIGRHGYAYLQGGGQRQLVERHAGRAQRRSPHPGGVAAAGRDRGNVSRVTLRAQRLDLGSVQRMPGYACGIRGLGTRNGYSGWPGPPRRGRTVGILRVKRVPCAPDVRAPRTQRQRQNQTGYTRGQDAAASTRKRGIFRQGEKGGGGGGGGGQYPKQDDAPRANERTLPHWIDYPRLRDGSECVGLWLRDARKYRPLLGAIVAGLRLKRQAGRLSSYPIPIARRVSIQGLASSQLFATLNAKPAKARDRESE